MLKEKHNSSLSGIILHLEEEGFESGNSIDENSVIICSKEVKNYTIKIRFNLNSEDGNLVAWIDGFENKRKILSEDITLWQSNPITIASTSTAIFKKILEEIYQIVDMFNSLIKHKIKVFFTAVYNPGYTQDIFARTEINCKKCHYVILWFYYKKTFIIFCPKDKELIKFETISSFNDKEYAEFVVSKKRCKCVIDFKFRKNAILEIE